jgi:hypothetical protein
VFSKRLLKKYLPYIMKNNIAEILIPLSLVAIALLLLNPFTFWMPSMMLIVILAIGLVVLALFASFVLREKNIDERDMLHSSIAGRNAFLAGVSVLMIGIAIEGYMHHVDMWLVLALIVMIIAKIVTRFWTDKNL